LFAPYGYRAHKFARADEGGRGSSFAGVNYAPLWSVPQDYRTELVGPQWLTEKNATGTVLDDLELDSGKLGLWWGAIA
jgi:hypothetical protein